MRNYCDKIKYTILTTEKADFPVMADQLLSQLPEDLVILRLVFFGMPSDNTIYLERRDILQQKVTTLFKGCMPALSYVSQPPLNSSLIVEVHGYCPDDTDQLSHRNINGIPYVLLENPSGRFLFAGGFQSDILHFSVARQSVEVFRLVGELLDREGFPVNSIVRQWNYIEEITSFDGEDQHYQSFNNARGDFYKTVQWTNGYPAATGIGVNPGGVLIDLDAALFLCPAAYATPIDNKLQVAAHAYSGEVLATAQQRKATPKFERAKSLTFDGRRVVYISGTAAIRGEESLKGMGLAEQLHITMENIAQLTGEAKPVMLRVYLKEKNDYSEAAQLIEGYVLNIPVSYMCADVCRDELLIEIEGVAIE